MFLAAFGCITVFALAAPYFAVSSDALYCRHSTVFWNPVDCYKFDVHGRSANVVLAGDSALSVGIEPRVIKQDTGLSAYNLGLTGGEIAYTPNLVVDHYLKHNRLPRVIVLYVSPWTMVLANPDMPHLWNDAARVAMRHGSLSEFASVMKDDPRRLIQLPMVVWRQGPAQFSLSESWWHTASAEMARDRGWIALMRTRSPGVTEIPGQGRPELAAQCHLAPRPLGAPDRARLDQFRARYERRGIPVMIYVAPIPDCDASYPAVVAAYRGIADNTPQRLPAQYFVDDGWRVHLDPRGATLASTQFATFLHHWIERPGGEPASAAWHHLASDPS